VNIHYNLCLFKSIYIETVDYGVYGMIRNLGAYATLMDMGSPTILPSLRVSDGAKALKGLRRYWSIS